MRPLLGYAILLATALAVSESRSRIRVRTVLGGLALHFALAVLLFHSAAARAAVSLLNRGMDALQHGTDQGSAFLFGYLGGAPLPFPETGPGASFVLAFKILPLVLVISALSALLLHWGILQRVTGAFAFVLRRALGLSGALSLGAATHVFLGMIEAPLLIRPYLAGLERGELFALMSAGMAGVAGTVMVLYATMLNPVLPGALATILTASVISTPVALAIAALMVPWSATPEDAIALARDEEHGTALEALARGTAAGVGPLVGIAATLLVAVALVSMADSALAALPPVGGASLSLERIAAWPFRPLMWLIGIPWAESQAAATLMGTKTVLNELVAYRDLAALPASTLSPESRRIVTVALCGFANFGSLGIVLGGLSAMVPERRAEIAALGLRTILAGTLATCFSGATAALLA